MLAGEGEELIALGALGNLDAVLVGPLLDLAVRPGVDQCVAKAFLSSRSRARGSGVDRLSVQASETRVAADGSDKLVTGRWLGCRVTTLI